MDTTQKPANVADDLIRTFNMYAPPNVESGFHDAWADILTDDYPPVFWTPENGGHWVAARAPIVEEVMGDYKRFSNRTIIIPKALASDHDLLPTTIDPPEHHFYRRTLTQLLAAPAISPMEGKITAIVNDLIDEFEGQGHCNFTQQFASILPIRIFLSMMNLPESDIAQTKYWADQITRPDGSMPFGVAMQNLKDYLTPFIDQRAGKDGTDMLSRLINTETNGRRLTREESIKVVVQVFIAGLDTVVNFLGFVFLFLAQNPDHRRQLASGEVACAGAVEEILRRYPLVTIGREVVSDIEFYGAQLKAGDMIAIPTPIAGMDESFNPHPETVDFDRKSIRSLTFGTGPHICPGKNLARTEVRITLQEWFRRIPEFTLRDEQSPTFTGGIVGVVDELNLEWSVPGQ